MAAPHRLVSLAAIAVTTAITGAGCIGSGSSGGNPSDEIDCTELTCDWTVVAGSPVFGATWHDGDLGVDLSAPGEQILELKDVFFVDHDARQMVLRAVLTRDPSATMRFELDFYSPGQAAGATFWDRAPVFLVRRSIDVTQIGTFIFARPVLVPSEGAAVILRVVKEGGGPAMLDELEFGA
ncbi:MAG: hypothetical protein ACHREM_03185 [Polyangiales bacterium]